MESGTSNEEASYKAIMAILLQADRTGSGHIPKDLLLAVLQGVVNSPLASEVGALEQFLAVTFPTDNIPIAGFLDFIFQRSPGVNTGSTYGDLASETSTANLESTYLDLQKLGDDKLRKIMEGMPDDLRRRLVLAMKVSNSNRLLPTPLRRAPTVIPVMALDDVYGWLNWSPEAGGKVHSALHKHFPGAHPAEGLHNRVKKILRSQFGCTGANTLFGSSVCPDEINNLKGSLPNLMVEEWGECFPMGGISGAPFVGRTGFKAFSSHVPDNGNIIILYAPHVALSPKGEVGKYLRDGQAECSTACGAVIGAYNACCKADCSKEELDFSDMQMGWIKSNIAPHAKELEKKEYPLTALSFHAFEMVDKVIQEVVNTNFGSGKLILLGGIQINMPEPCAEHFLPLKFEVRSAGKETQDLMDHLCLK